MKFGIITHVNHNKTGNEYFGYGPYVREMNIWLNYVDEVLIVAPLMKNKITAIDTAYKHQKIHFEKVPEFNFIGLVNVFYALLKMPVVFWKIFFVMYQADHIHLRCPGNMGLLGCLVQILFPWKKKTAKYAGNWDPKSKQPWTYKLQKYILNNTFLTKNMQVLVYGNWENQSKNIVSFFTATYADVEKQDIEKLDLKNESRFIFTGSLVEGKNPLYALKVIDELKKKKFNIILNIYGEGSERISLENYIINNKLGENVFLHGNQNKDLVKEAYKESHFVILPSKSEGWPKTIAEGMFWGCVPIATKVSCLPYMLDFGKRGLLLSMDLKKDVSEIQKIIENDKQFLKASTESVKWSQNYTTDLFESEIKKLVIE